MESRLTPSVNVLTYHNDIASTGLNSTETLLTTSNVMVNSFAKQFTTSLDGQVYAQPLVDTGITITDGPNTTSGSAGVHDVVFVATEHDSLYAIDTNVANSGKVLWQRSFTNIASGYIGTTPGTNINNIDGATAISTVTSGDVNSSDINPEIGITSTPVIDPSTNILYVLVKTKETISGNIYFVQQLHAITLADGTDAAQPYVVGQTTTSDTNNTNIFVYGTGDGSVTDPYFGTGQQVVQFDTLRQNNRSGLSLVNNSVYIAWASHGDNGPYHGWVVKWDVSHITTTGFNLAGVLCTSPNDGLAGIWQGGDRLVFEADGSAFYFETGNGSGGAPTLNAQGFPTNANYDEALVKAVADPNSTAQNQNPNGWGLKVADYFIPYNVNALDAADEDLGSGGPTLLPDSAGIPGHPHLLVMGGKEGKIYVVDRGNLGHFDPNNDHVLNAVPNGSGNNTPPVSVSGLLNAGAFYNGNLYFLSGYSGAAYEYSINSSGTLIAQSQTSIGNFGYVPGSPSISSNGTANGILWVMDRNQTEIHAYDANTLSTELWNSNQAAGDSIGSVTKFAVPTVANGEVFVGTLNSLVVYGLNQPPATKLVVSNFPSPTAAGAAQYFAVILYDANGNVAKGYTGTVYVTSSDPQAGLPADYKFTSVDQGIHVFSATLKTAGRQSLTGTDTVNSSLTGTESGIQINPGPPSTFAMSTVTTTTAGQAQSLVVTVYDAYQNLAAGYTGTVHFTSSDGQAVLPADYTFTAGDAGTHTFTFTLKAAGNISIKAQDTETSSFSGQSSIAVAPAAASQFVLTAPSQVFSSTAAQVSVTALDPFGNVATGYTGTIVFKSSDPAALLPPPQPFTSADQGTRTFSVSWVTGGSQSLTVTDQADASITGTAQNITVKESVAEHNAHFVVQLYHDILGRNADNFGFNFFTWVLDHNLETRAQVVGSILSSQEYQTDQIEGLYQKLLGRFVDPVGLTAWRRFLNRGGTIEKVEAAILGSPEFSQDHGGNAGGFLAALYPDVLGRPLDPAGSRFWNNVLSSGASRSTVALDVLMSQEATGDRVQGWYTALLARPADTGSLNQFTQQLEHGTTDEQVIGILLASDKYFARL